MNKLAQYRLIEKAASLFTKEHLSTILDWTVGPGITDDGALRLLVPMAFEKTAYRSASGISPSREATRGALFGGLMFTPYGMQSAAAKTIGGRRKAFAIPVAIGAGLGALGKGLMAKSDKNLIKSRGRKALKVVNIRERENLAAGRGATRGLATGLLMGAGAGAAIGKVLGRRFKKIKGIGALSFATQGSALAGLGGATIGGHRARRKFQRKNIWSY